MEKSISASPFGIAEEEAVTCSCAEICVHYLVMTHICLVRHGETDWNKRGLVQGSTDIPLNERGYLQAGATGGYLAESNWDYLYASPLSRAYGTAVTIAEKTGIPHISTDPRLQERHFGKAEGMDVALRKQYYNSRPIPGAETWNAVQARALEVMEELALRHPGSRLLVVSHGGLIGGLLSLISNGEIIPGNPPLRNACMNLLTYDGNWQVEWHNWVTPELAAVSAAD